MHYDSLLKLREMADQLSVVAQVLDITPFYLRAKQIRQIDKSLGILETLLTPEFLKEVKHWAEAANGLKILNEKLESIDKTQINIEQLEEKIEELKTLTRPWYALEDDERNDIVQHARRANEFSQNQSQNSEADVLQRYHRFMELKNLIGYADRANYLCDAIKHDINSERYKQNALKLKDKIHFVENHLKTLQRGFWFAIILCLGVATIPICAPFAVTLWKRKQRFEEHLTIYKEIECKERARLELAHDGVQVVKEIRDIMGDISHNEIQNLLMEIKNLKSEFQDSTRFLSVCAMLLNFMDIHADKLEALFGRMPEQSQEKFVWLSKNVHNFENSYKQLEHLQESRRALCLHKKHTTKGYERTIISQSIQQLQSTIDSTFQVSLSSEHRYDFAEICLQIPNLFKQIKEIIFYVGQNHDVDLTIWNSLQTSLHNYAQKLARFVLDAEICLQRHKEQTQESYETDNLRPNAIITQNLKEGMML